MDISEILRNYHGGQAEIITFGERHIFVGEILTIELAFLSLLIDFEWLAKGDTFPGCKYFVFDKETSFESRLSQGYFYFGPDSRLILNTHNNAGEIIIFHPEKNGWVVKPDNIICPPH